MQRPKWVRAAGADAVWFGEARTFNVLVAVRFTSYTGSVVNLIWIRGGGASMCQKTDQRKRPVPSAVLEGLRRERLEALKQMDPGQRMETAFALSLEAQKLFVAGLKAQGLTEAEIAAALKAKRR